MRYPPILCLLASLCWFGWALAQDEDDLGNGQLIVQTPGDVQTCTSLTVQWTWTGSLADAEMHSVSVGVVPMDNSRRALPESSHRLVKRKASHKLHSRAALIRIAGGSTITMSDGSWEWHSVGVPPGRYQIALDILNEGVTSFSDTFTITQGPDSSCLGASPTTTSDIPSSATSTSSPTDASSNVSSSTSAAVTEPVQPSAHTFGSDTSSSDHQNTNGGKIAAAVVVPIAIILAVVAFFLFRRRKVNASQVKRQAWSEKLSSLFHQGGPSHHRNISVPCNPVHAGGVTRHESAIRDEMREIRGAEGNPEICVPTIAKTWTDEAQDDDAHPISPEGMSEIIRLSTEGRPGVDPFYQQGSNSALGDDHQSRGLTTSTLSMDSSLPTSILDTSSHASFGQDAQGRPLQGDHDVYSSTDTHELSRSSSLNISEAKDLERNSSTRSIRRKPVPRMQSISQNGEAQQSDQVGPFSDENAVKGPPELLVPPSSRNHFSVQSGRTIADEQLHQLLDGEVELLRSSGNPSIMSNASESAGTMAGHENAPQNLALRGRSLVGPQSVTGSDAGSPFLDDSQTKNWKLSVQLGEEERGFRISFPVDRDSSA